VSLLSPTQEIIPHIEALRKTLLLCIGAVFVLYIPAYAAAPWCIKLLTAWACPASLGPLNYFSPMEAFLVRLKFSLVLSLVFSYPWCVFRIWNYVAPALYEREKRAARFWVTAASLLFLAGAVFCVVFVLPLIMKFSAGYASDALKPVIGLAHFIDLCGMLALAFGTVFQIPLVVLIAVRFRIISVEFLKEKRPYVITVLLIIAAILTPPDVVSQLMLFFPSWLLYEVGVFLAGRLPRGTETAVGTRLKNKSL